MAASSSSMAAAFFRMRDPDQNQRNPQHSSAPPPAEAPAQKKRRPGTPNPNAEVIALSPKTLMAANRFVCEVCHKGFQWEQNLQQHRRGHNLPWKLKQKNTNEGYFHVLFACIENLVGSLRVKDLVLPAADEAGSAWTKRFGFEKFAEDRIKLYEASFGRNRDSKERA